MSHIKTYAILPPAYIEYDPLAPDVAARVGALIEAAAPWARVEHIGSTAIPGCAGKGIVDLVALYPRGKLEATRAAIDDLEFQPQRTGHEFPDERPMRVGAIDFAESVYRLHVHIVAADSDEAVHGPGILLTDLVRRESARSSNPERVPPPTIRTPRENSSTQ